MQIQPTNNLGNIQQTRLGNSQISGEIKNSFQTPVDQVEFSSEAQMMMNGVDSGIRADLVAELKTQIASGRFETAERIEGTVERLIDEFA